MGLDVPSGDATALNFLLNLDVDLAGGNRRCGKRLAIKAVLSLPSGICSKAAFLGRSVSDGNLDVHVSVAEDGHFGIAGDKVLMVRGVSEVCEESEEVIAEDGHFGIAGDEVVMVRGVSEVYEAGEV